MFICPKCGEDLVGFHPEKCTCGYAIHRIESIYQFCDEPPISIEQAGRKYLGYEYVGENYSPSIVFGENQNDDYGLYGACSRKLIEILGISANVLDLGAGLGTASIPLAMTGAKTIAVDISQKMLAYAARIAADKKLEENLVIARMNAYNLLIADNSVDAVLELDMLHQVDNPEAVIKEILRVLKHDGVLVRYNCTGLPITDGQREIRDRCNEALKNIKEFYYGSLGDLGYEGLPFESWSAVDGCIDKYFERPEVVQTGYEETWTGRMKYEIHKVRTRTSGGAQLIPDTIHNAAWKKADEYAAERYGSDYWQMPGFNRYTGSLSLYTKKSD